MKGNWAHIENFCTISGPAGDHYIGTECQGQGPEWGKGRHNGHCDYNDCNYRQRIGSGCCSHAWKCCGWPGTAADCQRIQFLGDPTECCFNNCSDGKDVAKASFCKDSAGNTCSFGLNAKDFRTKYGPDCMHALTNVFLPIQVTPDTVKDATQLINIWLKDDDRAPIPYVIRVIRTNGANFPVNILPSLSYSPLGVEWARDLIFQLVQRINASEVWHIPSPIQSPKYHPFQEIIKKLCKDNPVICSMMLEDNCTAMNTDKVANSPELTTFCGCYMNDLQYKDYGDKFGVNKYCTPICNNKGNIPNTDGIGNLISCNQSTCIIDDIRVAVSNSSAYGVNVDQVCSNCTEKNPCNCVVSHDQLVVNDSEIKGIINVVKNKCQNILCSTPDPNNPGKIVVGPCSGDKTYELLKKYKEAKEGNERSNVLLWGFLMLTFVVFALILVVRAL